MRGDKILPTCEEFALKKWAMSPILTRGKSKWIVANAGEFVGLTTEWGSYHLIVSIFSVKS